jgi:hypothetical protein
MTKPLSKLKRIRLLVCGGRRYADRKTLYKVLDCFNQAIGIDCLIHGGADGADRLAKEWTEDANIPAIAYTADWDTYGRSAGPIRNTEMLVDGKPDLVLAFPGSAGTADMVKQARLHRIDVIQLKEEVA